MSTEQYAALREMLPPRRGDWRLLHDSARDGGFIHTVFHELCDGKGKRSGYRSTRGCVFVVTLLVFGFV